MKHVLSRLASTLVIAAAILMFFALFSLTFATGDGYIPPAKEEVSEVSVIEEESVESVPEREEGCEPEEEVEDIVEPDLAPEEPSPAPEKAPEPSQEAVTSAPTSEPEPAPVQKPDVNAEKLSRPGMVGRLYLDAAGMDPVACFLGNEQSITDAKDSANIYHGLNGIIIADHSHQNFSVFKVGKVSEGMTATLDCGNASYTLTCVDVCPQYELPYESNTGDLLGVFPELEDLSEYAVIYTCKPKWPSVTVTLWTVDDFDGLYGRL